MCCDQSVTSLHPIKNNQLQQVENWCTDIPWSWLEWSDRRHR